ncbi:O-antigen ligase family protein [Ectobacillus panaciterrae]|uniref:O-antigen ligase family protein n=1 Tax=Ectobacillus panaciterrae TaxID=363872 RepID=UPI0004014934|nr:O-antigen ligase family protein [Ectobacillus panaciterrae]
MLRKYNLGNTFEAFLLLFIILQPILDLLTSFCIIVLKINTTAGIIARLFVMVLGILYLFLQAREAKNRRYFLYILGLGIVLFIGLINNKIVKSPILLGEEVKLVAKTMYTFVMLGCYILVFRALKRKNELARNVQRSIMCATLIINAVMFISIITSTDYNSYDYVKLGSRGWFFAANELGTILAISFPVVLLYSIEHTKRMKDVYYWIPSLLSVFSLFAVGTKVGFGAIIVTLGAAIVMVFVQAILHRDQKSVLLLNGMIAVIMLAGVAVYTPFSPITKNTSMHETLLAEQVKQQEQEHQNKPKENQAAEEPPQGQVGDLVFSGRELFQNVQKAQFHKAPVLQKLFGMGYGGNFKKEPKLIERDFHDLFYSFGFIGFLLIMIPFAYYGIKLLLAVVTRFKEVFTVKYVLLAVGLVLAFGIAFMAGHVLTAPAVSIYLVLLWAYLLVSLGIE